MKARLVARDWQEIITFSFVDSRLEAALDPQGRPVKVLNPIAAQLDVMRTTMLPGLIETLRANLARKASRIRIFETGRVFLAARADATVPAAAPGRARLRRRAPGAVGQPAARRSTSST